MVKWILIYGTVFCSYCDVTCKARHYTMHSATDVCIACKLSSSPTHLRVLTQYRRLEE